MNPTVLFCSIIMHFILMFLLCQLIHSSSSVHSLCHKAESFLLLQFKESFSVQNSACMAHPKTLSWKLDEETRDCCRWDGVECDEETGHVIGLDISRSCLHGSISSNTSLSGLVHLKRLNLAYNNFSYSQIPSGFGQLSRLTYLNLSGSFFSGQIPSEILKLSELVSLNLSFNVDNVSSKKLLQLKSPDLGSLVQNLTKLEELDLSCVNISSRVPDVFVNFSSLTSIQLRDCGLHGELAIGIFDLPKLKVLNLMYNQDLTGQLPDFQPSSPLVDLSLAGTRFSGRLPPSIGNLVQLNELSLHSCNFSGLLPSSLGNLTQLISLDFSNNSFNGLVPSSLANLVQLRSLSLNQNNFTESTISWLNSLTKLNSLSLSHINLVGEIPYFACLTEVAHLNLSSNDLTGKIPSWLMDLTELVYLDLSFNRLQGTIPSSISNLKKLERLHLFKNKLSGTVELDMFVKLRNLTVLSLNNITFIPKTSPNATVQKFKALTLAACNLDEFPSFLRDQDELVSIDLSYNNIHGLIPTWVWNTSKDNLGFVNFSHNFLTGFEQHPAILPWPKLGILDLRANRLQGSLPIPPPSTLIYYVSDNILSGGVSPLFCNLTSLYALDLSNNNLSGKLPPCLGSFSRTLTILNLRNNKFHGPIPLIYSSGSRLKMIDLSQNRLGGKLPRSLANCTLLEFLILADNHIHDTFPHWLGTLPNLKVLILRANRFHGRINSPPTGPRFPKIRIIDLSYNHFSGKLPSSYLRDWNAMKTGNSMRLTYMQAIATIYLVGYSYYQHHDYSLSITNKGIKREYVRILDYFTAIDLSSNGFQGEIPEEISNLKQLHMLNLSNNILTGHIPPSLGNLKELESLDLSQNRLSGQIPDTLTQLTFLAFLNISYNILTGPVPRGRQFNTFLASSFEGNSGLCGNQLSKKCGNSEMPAPPPPEAEYDSDSDPGFEFNWIVISMGYASGLAIGLVLGYSYPPRRRNCFIKSFKWRNAIGRL